MDIGVTVGWAEPQRQQKLRFLQCILASLAMAAGHAYFFGTYQLPLLLYISQMMLSSAGVKLPCFSPGRR